MRVDELKKEIEKIKSIYENDSELNHKLGKDNYCLYCEKYNELLEEQKRLVLWLKRNV